MVRIIIMYSVVSAILLVASLGNYHVISTVEMEKTRDIAIMKSMGFHARDIRLIFLIEGVLIGIGGSALGILMGTGLMRLTQSVTVKPPGATDPVHLPVDWSLDQFLLAAGNAMMSPKAASYLPARKGGRVQPVDILRGAA